MKVSRHRFLFMYGPKSIPYVAYSNGDIKDTKRIVLLGTVQIGSSSRSVAQHMAPGTVVVQGAPHWFAAKDGSDISSFIFSYTADAINQILRQAKHKTVHLVADSQAAPGVIYYTKQSAQRINKISLIQPLGLNQSVFTGTNNERARILRERSRANLRRQASSLFTDLGLPRNHLRIAKYLLRDSLKGAAVAQYGSGLAYDSSDDLRALIGKVPIHIIAGENDKIFPPEEIVATLKRKGINVINDIQLSIVPDLPHSPLASRAGNKLLSLILD